LHIGLHHFHHPLGRLSPLPASLPVGRLRPLLDGVHHQQAQGLP
jgi:hypothetical protein